MLSRDIRAQAGAGQQVDALDKALCVALRASQHHPARAVAGHAVGLGQAVEGDTEQIRGQGGSGNVLCIVVEDAVVDFVGKQQE